MDITPADVICDVLYASRVNVECADGHERTMSADDLLVPAEVWDAYRLWVYWAAQHPPPTTTREVDAFYAGWIQGRLALLAAQRHVGAVTDGR